MNNHILSEKLKGNHYCLEKSSHGIRELAYGLPSREVLPLFKLVRKRQCKNTKILKTNNKTIKLGLIVILQAETGLKRRHDKRFQ